MKTKTYRVTLNDPKDENYIFISDVSTKEETKAIAERQLDDDETITKIEAI